MAADFNRGLDTVPGVDFPIHDVYRVNPADRDQGKSGQDQFRDTLDKKKQKKPEQDNPDESDSAAVGEVSVENASDRVVISHHLTDEPDKPPALLEANKDSDDESDPEDTKDTPPTVHIDIKA